MKKFKFSIEGNKFEVSVNEIDSNVVEIDVNGSHYNVVLDREVAAKPQQAPQRKAAGKVAPITPAAVPAAASPATIVKSQLPGSVIKVVVSEGQRVKKGDVVLTLESMKMENAIMAEFDGVVTKIFVQETQNVMQDDKLFEMQGEAQAAAPAPAPKAAPAAQPAAAPAPAATGGNTKPLKSPLPGSIIKIVASEGQAVKRGETLLTMESMKMENEIKAEKDCIVRAIKVTEGQSVMQDDVLLDLEY